VSFPQVNFGFGTFLPERHSHGLIVGQADATCARSRAS